MTRRYLRDSTWGTEPRPGQVEYVPRTEQSEAARAARDWLRERTVDDAPDWYEDDVIY